MNDEIVRRFWSRVKRGTPTECWPWIAYRNCKGYGLFWDGERTTAAHRFAYRLKHGAYSSQLVCHRCDNPPCCNPDHLFAGTDSDNVRDSVAKGRRAHIFGENNNRVILTLKQVIEIRERYAAGEYAIELAEKFGVSQPTISAICSGRNWKTAPGPITKRKRGPRNVMGEAGTGAKLTEAMVIEIRKLRARMSVTELAAQFSVSEACIYSLLSRHSWKHV